jgi:hypothetical protein
VVPGSDILPSFAAPSSVVRPRRLGSVEYPAYAEFKYPLPASSPLSLPLRPLPASSSLPFRKNPLMLPNSPVPELFDDTETEEYLRCLGENAATEDGAGELMVERRWCVVCSFFVTFPPCVAALDLELPLNRSFSTTWTSSWVSSSDELSCAGDRCGESSGSGSSEMRCERTCLPDEPRPELPRYEPYGREDIGGSVLVGKTNSRSVILCAAGRLMFEIEEEGEGEIGCALEEFE